MIGRKCQGLRLQPGGAADFFIVHSLEERGGGVWGEENKRKREWTGSTDDVAGRRVIRRGDGEGSTWKIGAQMGQNKRLLLTSQLQEGTIQEEGGS